MSPQFEWASSHYWFYKYNNTHTLKWSGDDVHHPFNILFIFQLFLYTWNDGRFYSWQLHLIRNLRNRGGLENQNVGKMSRREAFIISCIFHARGEQINWYICRGLNFSVLYTYYPMFPFSVVMKGSLSNLAWPKISQRYDNTRQPTAVSKCN